MHVFTTCTYTYALSLTTHSGETVFAHARSVHACMCHSASGQQPSAVQDIYRNNVYTLRTKISKVYPS